MWEICRGSKSNNTTEIFWNDARSKILYVCGSFITNHSLRLGQNKDGISHPGSLLLKCYKVKDIFFSILDKNIQIFFSQDKV